MYFESVDIYLSIFNQRFDGMKIVMGVQSYGKKISLVVAMYA